MLTLARADVHHLPLADESVDLVICSPPYEAARTYGIDFNLRGDAWVDWAMIGYMECLRVCRGLAAWVIEGQTRRFRWSATPMLLAAELHRRGVHLRKPPIFHRVGMPGSGGTTASVALQNGRHAVAFDIRQSQVELTRRRCAQVQLKLA